MHKIILATALAALLATAAPTRPAGAMAAPFPLPPAAANTALVQKTAVVCGFWGCRHVWRGRHWGYAHPPACPLDYYFACRRGPLGYGQCACWPYWAR